MIAFRQVIGVCGLDGNFYFKDLTNEISFVLVRNLEQVCIDFFLFPL